MTYVLKKKEIAYRKIGDEYFVVTTSDSTLHNLKGAGVRIFDLLDEGKSENEILPILRDEYDAPAAEIEADLASFLAELEAKGIVTRDDG
ncbi:MAG: PqqD family protein [bacterium]